MRRTHVLLATCLACLAIAQPLEGQETSSEPGIIVVQYFQCSPSAEDIFDEWVRTWRPYIEEEIENGELLEWGQLNHLWGDEWNRVLYTIARDLTSFHEAFDRFVAAAAEAEPEPLEAMREACPLHKDNIYSVVDQISPD